MGEETVRPSWLVVADGKDAEMALSLATWREGRVSCGDSVPHV